MAFRFFFGGIGAGLLAITLYGIFLQPTEQYKVGQLNPEGYSNFALFGACVIFASIIISTWGTHHFIPYFHQPEKKPIRPLKMLREMYETLATRNYLILLLSGIFGAVFAGINAGLSIYLRTYFWELTSAQISILSTTGLIAPFIAVLGSERLARRFGKKHTALGVLAAAVVIFLAPISLRLIDVLPPNGSTYLIAFLWIDTLIWVTLVLMSFIQAASMIADLAEEVAVKTGRRSEGVLFSADALLKQTIVGLGTFVAGLSLTWVDFPQTAIPGEVDGRTLNDLALLYLALAAVLNGLAIGILYLYRHDREQHETNLEILRQTYARQVSPGNDLNEL